MKLQLKTNPRRGLLGCAHALCALAAQVPHLFAQIQVFVHLSVPAFSKLAQPPPILCHCSSKPCSQANLSPGNTSAVHRGETSTRRERRGKRKGRTIALPLVFHLLALICMALQFYTSLAFTLSTSFQSVLFGNML